MTGADRTKDLARRDFEQRIESYVGLGWSVVERQEDPPRVRLVYRRGSRKFSPASAEKRDTGERVVWVDETGQVRVDRS